MRRRRLAPPCLLPAAPPAIDRQVIGRVIDALLELLWCQDGEISTCASCLHLAGSEQHGQGS